MDLSKVLVGCDLYPKPAASLEYGTAGFRTKAYLLNHVAFRCGILANLRSLATRQVVGLMITASHNPEEDNGVKIIDPDGGMLDFSWEELTTTLVNSEKSAIECEINTIISNHGIDGSQQGTVLLGWDSRPSSESLVCIASEGVCSIGGEAVHTAMCATPILHYLVRCRNDPAYGGATLDSYFDKLLNAFDALWKGSDTSCNNYQSELYFDGANGVGAISMKRVNAKLCDKVKVNFYNDDVGALGKLNFKCGADYIKLMQTFPENVPSHTYKRCVSFDGDADRILYYYIDDKKDFHLMDGDRMATLIAAYLKDVVTEANLNLSFGIVQTAYANGSSTKFITDQLKIEVSCVKTGVKYLHPKAHEYDIGIYFEANGHGTVVFSNQLKKELIEKRTTASGKELEALNTLYTFIDLTNETIGDAFSDLLLIEMILHKKDWDLRDWESCYQDLPNHQTKVTIKDRNVITTTDAERKVVTPENLQERIDELVARYDSARAFVRPSGTENIVRVYAEAATRTEAKELAKKVSRLVYDMANGTGSRP